MGLDDWQQKLSGISRLEPSNWPIEQLPGLSDEYKTALLGLGFKTTFHLLQNGRTAEQRQAIATRLQLHIQHVNKWVALANLARVPAVGCKYCGTVLHAGVASPQQLAQTDVARLHQQVLNLHVAEFQRKEGCPTVADVSAWINEAKTLTTSSQSSQRP
ncbi:MAG: DUF4332 domain-containing protein [Cyanothece sp. SIO2G6]|nr:DUF4332 domain-containing protein [Cyanothece sp. SIO2G6]